MNDSAIDHARRLLIGFGVTLAATRAQEHASVRALSSEIGVRPEIITRIEHGVWMPSPDEHRRLVEWMTCHPLDQR